VPDGAIDDAVEDQQRKRRHEPQMPRGRLRHPRGSCPKTRS
jgi:hypothetical protein